MSSLVQPCFAWTALPEGSPGFTEERFRVPSGEAARLPVTCLVGETDRLREFLDRMRTQTGKERLTDIWPALTAIVHLQSAPHAGILRSDEDAVLRLRVCHRPEGTLAVEDPRHGLLRLLVDHGLYYEFVPVETLDMAEPVRHGVAEVETGVPYAVALTSPAGLWACLIGLTVRFECLRPPLLELVRSPVRVEPARPERVRADAVAPVLSPRPPHQRPAGIPAALPGTPFHTPWSARADRG
jgi:hypothetical protein